MQTALFNSDAPKKSTNLSINSDLLQMAKASRINLSQALEQRLAELLREEQRRKWLEENHDAIDAYNSRIESDDVFSNGLRRF
ncbi:MAG: acetoacetyl-CoA synthase [Deltaproteobacteria bacterium RIFOXYD12_FULL_57_12]|nr:MAG: acetoacetyl-CoA synthase [Deltaproteobacteria bacterium RIFOXYD12_FULL_57_12]